MAGEGESGAGGVNEAGAAGEAGDTGVGGASGGAPNCPEQCTPEENAFCGAGVITWVCLGGPNFQEFLDAGCTDAGTQVPRLCCPEDYLVECQ
jgi:hypothetical protein